MCALVLSFIVGGFALSVGDPILASEGDRFTKSPDYLLVIVFGVFIYGALLRFMKKDKGGVMYAGNLFAYTALIDFFLYGMLRQLF